MFPELNLPRLSDEQIKTVEARIGRRLLPSEAIHSQLTRKPSLHSPIYRERVFGDGEVDPLERQIQEARKRVAEEKYAAASPGEKELLMLTELQEQTRAKAIAEAAAAERLKAAAPYLQKVNEQIAAHAFDETWDFDQYEVLVQARKHLSQPELNTAFGLELFQKAQDIVAEKENAKKSESQRRLDQLIAEKVRLEAELGVPTAPPSTAPARDAAWAEFKAAQDAVRGAKSRGAASEEIHKLLNTSEAKLKALNALEKAAAPSAPAPSTEAAA
jgi:hypothetical protein